MVNKNELNEMQEDALTNFLASESQFAQFSEYLDCIFIIRDIDYSIIYVNNAFLKTTGYSLADLKRNPSYLSKLFDTEQETSLKIQLHKNDWTQNKTLSTSYPITCRNKAVHWLEVHITAISDKEGKIIRYIETANDISQYKETEENLVANENRYRVLNDMKDRFLSILAHDLRNPFNSILGLSGLMVNNYNDFSDEDRLEMLKMVWESSQQAFGLIENLLEWGRAQGNQITYKPVRFNCKALIAEVIQTTISFAKNKKLYLIEDVSPDINVYADVNMVKTIIRNLIFNSMKFTPAEGRISITALKNKSFAEICVADTGIGINKDDLKKLFRTDVQHTTTGIANEKGTALGLLLCKEFAEKNHGTIWAASVEKMGSQFYFTLPLG